MARNAKTLNITLDQIKWYGEPPTMVGGGGGSLFSGGNWTHPFLWTIFFTADGSTLQIVEVVQQPVIGTAACTFSNGDHMDLGVNSMNPGDTILVPDGLNAFNSPLIPIPVPADFQKFPFNGKTMGVDQPGFFGAVIVIMNDGGHITSQGIKAGHDALNQAVEAAIDKLIIDSATQGQVPTQVQIKKAVEALNVSQKVKDAIINEQSFLENLWSASGADSELVDFTLFYSQDDFAASGSETKPLLLQAYDGNFVTWEVTGSITLSDQCPASAGSGVLNGLAGAAAISGGGIGQMKSEGELKQEGRLIVPDMSLVLQLMRNFRDSKKLLQNTSFMGWWDLAKKYTPDLVHQLSVNEPLREHLIAWIEGFTPYLKDDELRIDHALIESTTQFLNTLAERSGKGLKSDLQRISIVLPEIQDKTLEHALNILSERES